MFTKEGLFNKQDLIVDKSIEETFMKLKGLKLIGLKNTDDKIICRGYSLPAGAYEDFKTFIYCLNMINNYYKSDNNMVKKYLKEIIIESTNNIGYDEKIIAITGWNNFYKELREDNKSLFTNREILALIKEILDNKNEEEKHSLTKK